MATVMIRCPATGRAIQTGYEIDSGSFARTPVFFARTYCAACQSHHEWFAREAWLEEKPATRAQAAA